ncbi:MAG: hypothetical protein V3U75_01280 [Methylococcaceae bacterium]
MAYDDAQFFTRQVMPIADDGGISVPGTAAAATTLVRLRIPRDMTIDEADIVAMTGGTADGPNVILQKSLGGTGSGVGFATHNVGTSADNASAGLTVTSTDFTDGDHLLIVNAAGTAASTPAVTLNVGWKEKWVQ